MVMKVTPIAWTVFDDETAKYLTGCDLGGYKITSGQRLVEFAGRACYRAWIKSNPATATNAGYITNILEKRHGSVLEHASITWYIQGVSRSLTHELVRHRVGTAISQESQRYAEPDEEPVVPPALRDSVAHALINELWSVASRGYRLVNESARGIFDNTPGLTTREKIKGAREAARAVLPNMTPTSLTWTANYRTLRHIIDLRASVHADREIRELAIALLRDCQSIAPNVFRDYRIIKHVDGSEIAVSRFQPADVPTEAEWLAVHYEYDQGD